MAVDRNAEIKLQKSGKSDAEIAKLLDKNCSTMWKIVKKFQETGNPLDQPGRGRKRSVRSRQLLKNTREPLPKLQNLGHRSRCEQPHHALDAEGQSGGKAL